MGILSRLKGKPTTGDEDARKGAGLLLTGQPGFAIPLLERALQKPLGTTSRADILTMIGNAYNSLDKYDRALEYHDRALEEDPKNYKAWVNKGIVYRLKGDYTKARECYDRAMEIAPDYAELHVSLGALLELQENYTEAIQHLERAVQMNDALAVGHANLALAYAGAGRFDEAETSLRNAVARGYRQEKVIKGRMDEFRKKAKAVAGEQAPSAAAQPQPERKMASDIVKEMGGIPVVVGGTPRPSATTCCVCGKDLTGKPAMVDRLTGEAFCEGDSQYFGVERSQRPRRVA